MENQETTLSKREIKLLATIGILVIITLTSLVYAFVQQGIALENAREAVELKKKLDQAQRKADQQAAIMAHMLAQSNARVQEALSGVK